MRVELRGTNEREAQRMEKSVMAALDGVWGGYPHGVLLAFD